MKRILLAFVILFTSVSVLACPCHKYHGKKHHGKRSISSQTMKKSTKNNAKTNAAEQTNDANATY